MSGADWEAVAPHTSRLAVPGGWLYRVRTARRGYGGGNHLELDQVSVVFVPGDSTLDAQHAKGEARSESARNRESEGEQNPNV